MARFSAIFSDSSDSESSSSRENGTPPRRVPESVQEEDESDSESSTSSSSDLHEDELLPSPSRGKKPTRNALIEDDDGEIHYAHEMNETSPRRSPTRTRADPTIIPWAQHVGVDAQKMHVMQTSLFRVPEEAAALRAMNQPRRSHLTVHPTLHRKHSRDSEGDVPRIDSRERASFAYNIEPPSYRPSRKYARVESSASVVTGQERSMVDAGLAMGRSFRPGWGPGGVLVHLGEICSPSSTPKSSANSSIITKTTIPAFPSSGAEEADLVSKLLQRHLTNTSINPDEDGIPFANPSSDLCFASFTSLFPPTDRSYEALLFRLGQALFDNIDLELGDSITIDLHRLSALHRKVALSEWLEDAVSAAVDADLKNSPSADSAVVAFTLLTGNKVDKACDAAIDGGNVKLSTLISQAAGDPEFKDDLRSQLQIWHEQRIDAHIDVNIRKVYALLAGIVDVVEGSKRTGMERCADVDVMKGLDWKRTLGVHLWFSEPVDATIAHVFQAYNQLRTDSPARVTQPLPWYAENPSESSKSSPWTLPSSTPPPDVLFSLIRLHADPASPLSHVLTPFSFGPSPVDYSLSWHLYILLSRCMRIRDFPDRGDPGVDVDMDGDVDEHMGVEGHSPSADLLASSYAFQLEQIGMIQEALFVLLHIEGSKGREKVIKEVLSRSAHKLDERMSRGIVGGLKIPLAWVNEAKAIHAVDNGRAYEAYELYLAANLCNQAHDLAVLELAPDAIVRKDLQLLKSLFAKIASQAVNDWHVRGKAFLDYVHIMTRLPELHEQLQDQDAIPDASQALELEELVRSIPKLIGILPDVLRDRCNVRHNAALAEMIAGLIMTLDKAQPLVLAQSQVQPTLVNVDAATKLRHIRSSAFERFKVMVEVS